MFELKKNKDILAEAGININTGVEFIDTSRPMQAAYGVFEQGSFTTIIAACPVKREYYGVMVAEDDGIPFRSELTQQECLAALKTEWFKRTTPAERLEILESALRGMAHRHAIVKC
jgi:hypothetical protein